MLPRIERKVCYSGANILVKYLQNLSAMSMGSVIVLSSDLNDEGRDGLFLRLFVTLFSSFHVVLIWHLLGWSRNMYA